MTRFPLRPRPCACALLLLAALVPVAGTLHPPEAAADRGRPGTAPARAAAPPSAAHGTYHPPVDAPITDPFRPPLVPWGPGNRGIEYATRPGTPVMAIGAGEVTFAGAIAGSLYVTVLHPDGIRSSYSYLATIQVAVGDRVSATTAVGLAAARMHLGARRGDTYIDPAGLWGRPVGPPHVLLVPLDGRGAAPAAASARWVPAWASAAAGTWAADVWPSAW